MELKIDKKTLKRVLLGVILCIGVYWILSSFSKVRAIYNIFMGIFSPFIVGAVIAFIVNVPMRWLESKMLRIKKDAGRRVTAMILSFLMVMLILAVVLWLLIPELIHTIYSLAPKLENFVYTVQEYINHILKTNPQIMEWFNDGTGLSELDWSSIVPQLLGLLETSFSAVLSKTLTAAMSLSDFFIDAFIAVVFAIYLLFQKEQLARQCRRFMYAFFSEKHADGVIRVMRMSNVAFSRFLSGQCIEVCILGSMFAISMAIFEMPFIPLISVLIAVTAFVPYVGAWIGCIVGAFFIMVVDPTKAFWFVIMFLILQQIENNLIYPRVVGTSIGLSGMWVLLAISVGGELFGVFGMIVMIPVASVAYTLLSEFTAKRISKRGIDAEKLSAQPPEATAKKKKEKKEKKQSKEA